MATQLSTFTEMGLIDARGGTGVITLPLSTQIPGRIISFKDIYGVTSNSTIVLATSTPDVFEDGTNYRSFIGNYDYLSLHAASTGVWYTVGGSQFNYLRATTFSNSGISYVGTLSTLAITTPTINATTGTITTLNATTTGTITTLNATTGNITNMVGTNVTITSTITSNISHPLGQLATIYAGASLAPAYSTSKISTISLGTSTNRWYQIYALSTLTSTIITDNANVNNLVGGPILNATTTTNIYPFSAGSLVGFGATIASNGFYAEGHFRSTFTQVIQPTLDAGQFSNIVYINGSISTPNMYISSINQKMPPFWSTLNIPNSTFIINGTLAGNPAVPIVLYSNVQFPPYTKGMYKIYQRAILTKSSAGGTDIHGNIFYTQGTFPSTPGLFHDGYCSLPFVNNNGFSSFTSLFTYCAISSITTRNICYYDQSAASYTANLYMGRLAVEYVPSVGVTSDIGQNIS